uniref:MHC class I-like antigen recognition-like domain-containing protein n=1 Tax=Anguilla anguilla TaxID=7936 RepID=A0A0E9QGE1_ANGAN
MFVLRVFVVCHLFWGSQADVHALLGTYTAVNTDEFTCVLWLDGEAVDSYSSNGRVSMPCRNWMREGRGHSLWNSVKRLNMEHWNRGRTDILKMT